MLNAHPFLHNGQTQPVFLKDLSRKSTRLYLVQSLSRGFLSEICISGAQASALKRLLLLLGSRLSLRPQRLAPLRHRRLTPIRHRRLAPLRYFRLAPIRLLCLLFLGLLV